MTHYTDILLRKKARVKLMKGAKLVYDLVSTTLGPRGKNVAINKGYDTEIQHDGLKVSRFVQPKNKFEAVGAQFIREATEKHVSEVGDGTTLTAILSYHIAKEAMILIESGVNAMSLKNSLEKGRDILIDEVKRLSKPIKTQEEKIQIATISSADPKLGQMIGETYHKIGVDGIITADESKSHETTLEHQEGISIDHGWLSPWFINDPRTLTATVRDAHILLLDRALEDIYEILPFIETQLKPQNVRNLVIIANDVKGNALASFIETRKKGLMNILCVKAPAFGKYKSELLHDIAVMCGGQVIDENMQIKDATFDYLGFAKVVKASRDSTVILENKGSVKAIKQRIASIKLLLKDPDSDLDKEKLQERLSKMTGGVYVIKTGGATEVEMAERKERVEDAILATRAAIQGGIIPGGEVALLTASNKLIPTNQ